jgi:hypothetical protein
MWNVPKSETFDHGHGGTRQGRRARDGGVFEPHIEDPAPATVGSGSWAGKRRQEGGVSSWGCGSTLCEALWREVVRWVRRRALGLGHNESHVAARGWGQSQAQGSYGYKMGWLGDQGAIREGYPACTPIYTCAWFPSSFEPEKNTSTYNSISAHLQWSSASVYPLPATCTFIPCTYSHMWTQLPSAPACNCTAIMRRFGSQPMGLGLGGNLTR